MVCFICPVIGRIHPFGQLRTIGMTKKQIKKFVLREGGVLFLCSALAGILIGCIARYFMVPDGFHIRNDLLATALVFIAVYLITMFSVCKPARIPRFTNVFPCFSLTPDFGRSPGQSLEQTQYPRMFPDALPINLQK